MKANKLSLLVVFLLLLAGASVSANDGDIGAKGTTSRAPASIPIDSTGTPASKVLMLDIPVHAENTTTEIDQMQIDLEGTSTIAAADVSMVYVYFEPQGGNDLFDDAAVDDVLIYSGTGTATFGNLVTMTVAHSIPAPSGNSRANVYIVLDFVDLGTQPNLDTYTVGVDVIDIRPEGYPTYDYDPTGGNDSLAAIVSDAVNLDDYEVTLTADSSGLGLSTASPGDQVTTLQLDFNVLDTSLINAQPTGGYATIDFMRFRNTGDAADSDFAAGGVEVFQDANANKVYEFGTDTILGSASMGNVTTGYADVTLSTPITLDSANLQYYVLVTVAAGGTPTKTIGLEVMDPSDSANVGFADGITDAGVTSEYLQTGYITSSATTPASGATFTITSAPDSTPPTVQQRSPINGATSVLVNITVDVQFDENMDPATIIDANFSLVGATSGAVSGTVSYISATDTLRFTPASVLPASDVYTATTTTGVTDVAGNALAANDVFTFTTEASPTVAFTSPSSDATFQLVNVNIVATFNDTMDAAGSAFEK